MKFLVDENLSRILADVLTKAGHDAVHIVDLGASSAPDPEVMALAESQGRIIVSADTDFGSLLASTRATQPSTILVRELVTLPPQDLADVLIRHLDLVEEHLASGAIVAFGPGGIRVRALPLR